MINKQLQRCFPPCPLFPNCGRNSSVGEVLDDTLHQKKSIISNDYYSKDIKYLLTAVLYYIIFSTDLDFCNIYKSLKGGKGYGEEFDRDGG